MISETYLNSADLVLSNEIMDTMDPQSMIDMDEFSWLPTTFLPPFGVIKELLHFNGQTNA